MSLGAAHIIGLTSVCLASLPQRVGATTPVCVLVCARKTESRARFLPPAMGRTL